MRITFISNFMNHHQLPLALEFDKLCKGEYTFIATTPTSEERLNMGYESMNDKYPFILKMYESEKAKTKAKRILFESDVVISGASPDEYIMPRLKANKLTFKYTERLYRKSYAFKNIYRSLRAKKQFSKFEKYPLYILCAGVHAIEDMERFPKFKDRLFKWGYFPNAIGYDADKLIQNKKANRLLWCGRFLDWKHPEFAIEIAKRLDFEGYDFSMKIIGTGPMENTLKKQISNNNLSDKVTVCGPMPNSEVRKNMEQAGIYIFTSDAGEGWGAVQNEAMNSCCAVVSNNEIGSTPFLLKDNRNGFVCHNNDIGEFCDKIKKLLHNPEKQRQLGQEAYNTILNDWNSAIAAKRFIELSKAILAGDSAPKLYKDGVCSAAIT